MSSVTGISSSFGVKQTSNNKKQRFYTYAVKRSIFSAQPASVYSKNSSKLVRGLRHIVKTAETGEEQQLADKPVQTERQEIVPEQEQEQEQQQEQAPFQQRQQGLRRDVTLPFANIQVGEIYPGKVERIANFGAFVNIGSEVEGLVHISQLAYEFVSDPAQYVQVGQEVMVKVVDKNEADMRIGLSMKIKAPEGGQQGGGGGRGGGAGRGSKIALEDLETDTVVTGRVARVTGFGAFVDIGAESDGLVHVSQMSNEYVSEVGDIVQEGDEVQVRILEVDMGKRQIKLSMKGEQGDQEEGEYEEGEEADEFAREKRQMRRQNMEKGSRRQQAPPPPVSEGDSITGPVKRVAAYGVFIDIGGGFQAMLHKNEMKVDNTDPLWQVRDFFQLEQDVTVTVQKVEENRIELTQKSQSDRDDEATFKAGWVAVDEEDNYKPSLFADALTAAGLKRSKFPNFPERAIIDPPQDLLPDIVEEAIEEVVEEVTAEQQGEDTVTEEVTLEVEEQVVEEDKSVVENVEEVTEPIPQTPEPVEEVAEKVEEAAEQEPVVENTVEAPEKAEQEEKEVTETIPETPEPVQEVVEKVEEAVEQAPVVKDVTETPETESAPVKNVSEHEQIQEAAVQDEPQIEESTTTTDVQDTVSEVEQVSEQAEQSEQIVSESEVEETASGQITESAPVAEAGVETPGSEVSEQDTESVSSLSSEGSSSTEAESVAESEIKSES